MKILWVKSDFLHPTTRGGQIRTLEMLRRLHARHAVHYVAFENPLEPEGVARSSEYCVRAYPIPHVIPPRRSLQFAGQLVRGFWKAEPVSISRYRSPAMREVVANLVDSERFDCVVCDFLTPTVNIPRLENVVLFQHNVECVIWERHAAAATNPFARYYLARQAEKMARFERAVCRAAGRVVTVSDADARTMLTRFGVRNVHAIPTGVDVEFFTPPMQRTAASHQLVFVGSMDWLPNIDAIRFFVSSVWPLIRKGRPECRLTIVGRRPPEEIRDLSKADPRITVTGTVDDVRPYLWEAAVSIVPLRIGGGTRLKIYESMASRTPVVSTSVGAEGLDVSSPQEIRLADTPEAFASSCLTLLTDANERKTVSDAAWRKVSSQFSWDRVVLDFETLLTHPSARS